MYLTDIPQHRLDAIVIGGGPAGLSAGTYLARFRRSCLLIDAGQSRLGLVAKARNYPGAKNGTRGADILSTMITLAAEYGVTFLAGRVSDIQADPEGFSVEVGSRTYCSRSVFLATGVQDNWPQLAGLEMGLANEVVAICPVCHAYEAKGSIAILADNPRCVGEARFLSRTADVTVLDISQRGFDRKTAEALWQIGARIIKTTLASLSIEPDYVLHKPPQGATERFERMFIATGASPRSSLAADLGAKLSDGGIVAVDPFCETSVANLFAIGDVAEGLDQIVVAQANGAIAASHFHAREIGQHS